MTSPGFSKESDGIQHILFTRVSAGPQYGIKPKGMCIKSLSVPAVSDRTPLFQGPTFYYYKFIIEILISDPLF